MSSYTDECDEISGDVYGFYLLLTALLSSTSRPETCGLKTLREEMRARIRSSVMSLSQIRLTESDVDSQHV